MAFDVGFHNSAIALLIKSTSMVPEGYLRFSMSRSGNDEGGGGGG